MKTISMMVMVLVGAVMFGGCDVAVPPVTDGGSQQCPVAMLPQVFDVSNPVGAFTGEAVAAPLVGEATGSAWYVAIEADGDGGFCLKPSPQDTCVFSVVPFGQESFRAELTGAPFRYNTETWHARTVTVVTHYGQQGHGVVDVFITADEGAMTWRLEQQLPH